MTLPVVVPMFALPLVTLMPHRTPFVVFAPLELSKAMFLIVLPWMFDTVPPAVNAQLIPTKRVALAVPVKV
jgi:hypothetical protein